MGFFINRGNPDFRMKTLQCPFCGTKMEFSGQYSMSFSLMSSGADVPGYERLEGYPRGSAYLCPGCRYMALFRE
jgi:uncharacterized protein (DUF2225 family)